MSYIKKSYCFSNTPNGSKMRVFAGHIKKETATRLGFDRVNLAIIDMSGRGRGETRYFFKPFENMNKFN
jgi:hypothetical protein